MGLFHPELRAATRALKKAKRACPDRPRFRNIPNAALTSWAYAFCAVSSKAPDRDGLLGFKCGASDAGD
jgi:hypothetical protein